MYDRRIFLTSTCGFLLAGWGLATAGCGLGGRDTIMRVSRQNNSGTYHYFREAVLGKEREYKLGSVDQSGSKDVVELVSGTPSAIGYSGMGYATEKVKMLKLSRGDGKPAVAPTIDNALDGSYPLARPLYVYLVGEPTGAIRRYLDWILSEEGQAIVAEVGYVPVDPVPLADDAASADQAAISIRVAGSDTMVNLAQAWAERYHKVEPHVSVQVSGGGSGVGIAALIDGTTDLANASREMKPEERATAEERTGKKVKEFVVALDALAVYVHKNNPIDAITLPQLAEIYGEGGSITGWSQLNADTDGP